MEEKTINKPANFLSRIASTFINIFLVVLIITPLSLIAINNEQGIYTLNHTFYYVWLVLFIVVLFLLFVLIPLFFKGRNIGELLLFIKPILEKEEKGKFSLLVLVLRKNYIGSFLWIFVILCCISFVPPTSAQKIFILQKDESKINELTTWELMGISIPALLSPLIIIINLFNLVSISINKNYCSFFDRLNNIKFIFIRKFEKINLVSSIDIQPEKKEKIEINWKD